MLTILSCLRDEHDPLYIAAASLVCVIGSLLSMRLLARVRRNVGARRINLLFLTGLVAGGTVWTTHFTAMLGYGSSLERAFEPSLTFLSLGVAVLFSWLGFFITTQSRLGPAVEIGGGIFGCGIAAMHYMGMAAFKVSALLVWNPSLVIISVVCAAVFGAIAANRIARPITRFCKYGGTLAMILAIVCLHFIGMAAVTLVPIAGIDVPAQALSDLFLLGTVIAGITLIMAMGSSAYAIDLKAAQEATDNYRHLALHDPLTGLPNRHGLAQRLTELLDGRVDDTARVVVLAIDLDRFKDVNDAHGHAAGDAVLKEVARRLSATLQEGEFLARIGGDEFVAVKSNVFARAQAMKFADRFRDLVIDPIDWQHRRLSIGCSIGIALFPEHGLSADELSARADLAMYRAKTLGQSKICTYEASMDEVSRARAEIAIDLKRALVANEFEIFYQVQNDVISGDIVGFEALLRWNHPEKGRVRPDEFIPIAEQTGLIVDIGDWVLLNACRAASNWKRPYRVAVNIAAVQLNHNLPERVAEALQKTGLPPERLEIELTESGIIADRQHALQVVLALKSIGVTIAMDDFGTGYSSLSTLQAFPFDKIKIDKSFIQSVETNVHAAAIIKATLLLGRSLNIPVLAEGVETERHLQFLRDERCDSVQGFLFGKPMSHDDVSRFISLSGDCAGDEPVKDQLSVAA